MEKLKSTVGNIERELALISTLLSETKVEPSASMLSQVLTQMAQRLQAALEEE